MSIRQSYFVAIFALLIVAALLPLEVQACRVEILEPDENDVHLKREEINWQAKFYPTDTPPEDISWNFFYTQGSGTPSSGSGTQVGTIREFHSTVTSEGTVKLKVQATVSATTYEDERTIKAVLPNVTKISFEGSHTLKKHETDSYITNPVWIKPLGQSVSKNDEAAYTKSGNATAELEIEASDSLTNSTSVQVQGVKVVADDENFYQQGAWFHDWTWSPGELQLTSSPLYSSVNYYDTLDVKWQYRVQKLADGWGNWVEMNQSSHKVYITLKDPIVTTYVKLLDFTCEWAVNQTDPDGTFDEIWGSIAAQDTGYKYYGTGQYGSTTRLLMKYGNGDCDGWANFMVDCCGVHGMSASNHHIEESPGYEWIVIKNVNYGTEYQAGPPRKTFYEDDNPVSGIDGLDLSPTGVPGQGMSTPGAKVFNFHAVVEKTSSSGYYDPSYMTTWADEAAFRNSLAGQVKNEDIVWQCVGYYDVPLVVEPPY